MYNVKGKDEQEARERLERAWSKMATDPDLKFFLSQFLSWSGLLSPPATNNAIETARFLGRMDAGQFLLSEMEAYQPYLFPLLMKENIDYDRSSNRSDTEPGSDAE